MHTVQSASPQFLVDDLHATLAFYEETLGFNVDFVYEEFYAGISLEHFRLEMSDRRCATP